MQDDKSRLVKISDTAVPPKKPVFSGAVFSTAYLPPISYFKALYKEDNLLLEAHENYNKQSYRNRCYIAGANGKEVLTIPIESNEGKKIPIRDVRIAPHGNWQQIHRRALRSAYSSSPYFEYYVDEFIRFYENKWTFLWDYNWELLTLIFNFLEWDKSIYITDNYAVDYTDKQDYRTTIHPKKESPYDITPYYQVFREKHGFIADLSIVDLLFNKGNEAVFTLIEN